MLVTSFMTFDLWLFIFSLPVGCLLFPSTEYILPSSVEYASGIQTINKDFQKFFHPTLTSLSAVIKISSFPCGSSREKAACICSPVSI
jgi:hypothetical protein